MVVQGVLAGVERCALHRPVGESDAKQHHDAAVEIQLLGA